MPAADARVRVVPRWQLTLERLAKLNRAAPTLGIVASGVAPVCSRSGAACLLTRSAASSDKAECHKANFHKANLQQLEAAGMRMRMAPSHLVAVSGTGFGASDTSRPPPPATGAGSCPSRGAVQVQAALTILRRSSGGGDVCKDGGGVGICNDDSGSAPSDARPAHGNGGGDCSSGTANGGSGGRLNLSAYAALLAAFRVPDPSDAAPPTPEGAHHFRTLSSAPPNPIGRLFD